MKIIGFSVLARIELIFKHSVFMNFYLVLLLNFKLGSELHSLADGDKKA